MNILLCCDGGFSTSLVVSKMKEAIKDRQETFKIWAISVNSLDEHIQEADVVLIGPHMVFRKEMIESKAKQYHIPVAVIAAMDYGTCNGPNVVQLAIDTIGGKKNE